MNTRAILLASLALTGTTMAEMPRKAPLTTYARLWTDSPFTTKPKQEGPVEGPNILDDYALLGIAPISEGYRVTIMNKKNPEERVFVESGKTVDGFKIVEVIRKAGDPLGTVVRMMSGSVTGTVAFDEKLLTIKTAAPAAPAGARPSQPLQPGQQVQPGQPQPVPGQPGAAPQIRPRVVPPPTTGAATPQTPQNNATQGRPGGSGRSDRRGGR